MPSSDPKYYPKLSDLIQAADIPGDLYQMEDLAQQGINAILGNLRYTRLNIHHSPDGDTKFYSMTLLTKEMSLPILDTGMKLIFFDGEPDYSEIDIASDWRFPIMRYISEFECQGFSYAPEAFLDILLSMADIESPEEALEEMTSIFLSNGTAPYTDFINEVKENFENIRDNWNGDPGIKSELQNIIDEIGNIKTELGNLIQTGEDEKLLDVIRNYKNDSAYQNILTAVDSAKNSIDYINNTADVDIDIYKTFIDAFLKDITDLDDKIEQLIDLFQKWLGNITREDIEYLLVPQFGFELLDINMSLEFPRKWLIPLIKKVESGNTYWLPDPDPEHTSTLKFTVGNLKYHTTTGFKFENETYADFTYSQIGKSGFTIFVKKLRADLSRKTNIAQATANGRPVEFQGIYCEEAFIGLPAKWFKEDDNQTLAIYGKNLIIGTGGVSGKIGLDVKNSAFTPAAANQTMDWTLGKLQSDGSRKGFKIGFETFNMEWQQDSLVECDVKGYIQIPNFKSLKRKSGGGFENVSSDDLKIKIEAMFDAEGDFTFTAQPKRIDENDEEHDWIFGIGNEGKILAIIVKSLKVVKDVNPDNHDEDQVYIQVKGAFDFSNNNILKNKLKEPIEVDLKIYRDGSFELVNGSIPIPDPGPMQLGPVNLNITNISLGSEDINPKYKFISFDCAVSTGPVGVDAKANGVALYFPNDGDFNKMFLKIKGIAIDITIPGTASDETAALILKGYLSMDESEYTGGISLSIPKAKIKGGAAMKMQPKVPAWIVDSYLELPTAIPLGPVGLYGFRGLFGLRYVPNLPEGAVSDPELFYDFYDEEVDNPLGGQKKGLHLGKFEMPEKTGDAGTPLSIGAGAIIGTLPDDGNTFSVHAFLFLTVPEFLLVISGQANVLDERVSFLGEDPPFFAYLVFTEEFISIGMGADYKISKTDGKVLELDVEAKMAFFFRNPSAWYIHFGTDVQPIQAKILKDIFSLNAYAYLMLSSQGIATGAGVKFEFSKSYGPVAVSAKAYVDVWARMSFKQIEIGGGIAIGGSITASVFGISLYIGLDAYLSAMAPKPFIVKGGVRVCVAVKLLIKKFEKCFNIEFCWEFNKNYDITEIGIFENPTFSMPAGGFHLGSKRPYELTEIQLVTMGAVNTALNNISLSNLKTLPLDSQIDVQMAKAVDPSQLVSIGGFTNPPVENTEFVSPKNINGVQVKHYFEIDEVKLLVKTPSGSWVDYNPYEALADDTFVPGNSLDVSDMKIGYWQKKGREYNNLKVLSTQPLEFIDNMAGKVIPEELGMTASTLFCKTREKIGHCINWDSERFILPKNQLKIYKEVLFKVYKEDAFSSQVSTFFNLSDALILSNESKLEVYFKDEIHSFHLKMLSFVDQITLNIYGYQKASTPAQDENGETIPNEWTISDTRLKFELIKSLQLNAIDLISPIHFESDQLAISKIELIFPCFANNKKEQSKIQLEIEKLELQKLKEGAKKQELSRQIRTLKDQLENKAIDCCPVFNSDAQINEINARIETLQSEMDTLKTQWEELTTAKDHICAEATALSDLMDCIKNHKYDTCITISCLDTKSDQNDAQLEKWKKELERIQQLSDKCCEGSQKRLAGFYEKLSKNYENARKHCESLESEINTIENQMIDLKKQIDALENRKEETEKLEQLSTCQSYLYELCYVTIDDHIRAQSFPSQAAIEADYSHIFDANSQVIAPILRPDESYLVQVNTVEKVDYPDGHTEYKRALLIPFKTEGPIGHFDIQAHLPAEVLSTLEKSPGGGFSQEIEVPENNLRFYLDELRCYPNMMGNISNAKPMYYQKPEVLLFFNQPFARHFFSHWKSYNGLPERDSQLIVEIKDPAANSQLSAENLDPNSISSSLPNLSTLPELAWVRDENVRVPNSLDLLNSLRNPKIKNEDFFGTTCWTIGGDPIIPYSQRPELDIEPLKPSKLYNILLFNDYKKQAGDVVQRKQIHSYPFQTSRYADLKAHIESYIQTEQFGDYMVETMVPEKKKAVFFIENSEVDLQTRLIYTGLGVDEVFNNDIDQTLVSEFPDIYQRAIYGLLNWNQIPNANRTEFNFITDNIGDIEAILVRTAEPLNDPSIAYESMYESIELVVNHQTYQSVKRNKQELENNSFTDVQTVIGLFQGNSMFKICNIIYSVDRCNALIIPFGKLKPSDNVQIKFKYYLWNGNEYAERDQYITTNLLSS